MTERTKHLLTVIFFYLMCYSFASAQQGSSPIPIDTTYTVSGTYYKLVRQYPHIKVARSDTNAVRVMNDIVYLTLAETPFGKRDLHADVYIPRSKKKVFPSLMMIHGGGWRAGNKQLNTEMAKALASKGFVVISVEYRLSLEAKYPAAIHDLTAAIRWMKTHAKAYQIDTSKIAIGGYSAGGQLASLIGVTNGQKVFDSPLGGMKPSRQVHAVINMDGLLDFTHPESLAVKRTENSADVFWFQGYYEDIPERWKEASALTWVHRNAPPFLFINSSQTRFHAGYADMVKRLNEYGIYNEVHKLHDAPHSYWFFHPWFEPTIEHMSNFLNKVFNLPHTKK